MTMTTTELFEAYRAGPASETLLSLLRGIQDFVYNLCYQVLRHPEDAEDAAQKVLLRILDALPRVTSGEHLRSLLVRISFQVSLNASQARATRNKHERSKAAMTSPSVPESPEEVPALHRAIAALPPGLAELVIDRYFEGKALDRLAEIQGCSVAAVWKRLEKAKENLRSLLRRAGFGAVASVLEPRLEAIQFAPCPKDLFTPAIATKVQAVARAAAALSTTSAAGSAGAQILSGRTAALGLLSLLLGGLGGGVFVALSREAEESEVSRVPHRIERPRERSDPSARSGAGSATLHPSAADSPRDLHSRLREYRDLVSGPRKIQMAAEARRRELQGRMHVGVSFEPEEWQTLSTRLERSKQLLASLSTQGWTEFHKAVFEDPVSYVSVLLEPGSADVCRDLLQLLAIAPGFDGAFISRNCLPPPLLEAMDLLVSSGTAEQKLAVFDASGKTVGDPWLERVCVRFLSESDPRLVDDALWILGDSKSLGQHLDVLKACWSRMPAWPVREKTLQCLDRLDSPEARTLFWDCARDALDRSAGRPTDLVASWPIVFSAPPRPGEEDQYAALLSQALKAAFDVKSLLAFRGLLKGALNLPLPRAVRMLEEVEPSLHPILGTAVGRMARRIRAGETRPEPLLDSFDSALPLKENW